MAYNCVNPHCKHQRKEYHYVCQVCWDKLPRELRLAIFNGNNYDAMVRNEFTIRITRFFLERKV